MLYHDKLVRVITALECVLISIRFVHFITKQQYPFDSGWSYSLRFITVIWNENLVSCVIRYDLWMAFVSTYALISFLFSYSYVWNQFCRPTKSFRKMWFISSRVSTEAGLSKLPQLPLGPTDWLTARFRLSWHLGDSCHRQWTDWLRVYFPMNNLNIIS